MRKAHIAVIALVLLTLLGVFLAGSSSRREDDVDPSARSGQNNTRDTDIPATRVENSTDRASPTVSFRVYGSVKSKIHGLPISGVFVLFDNHGHVATTDQDGTFDFEVPDMDVTGRSVRIAIGGLRGWPEPERAYSQKLSPAGEGAFRADFLIDKLFRVYGRIRSVTGAPVQSGVRVRWTRDDPPLHGTRTAPTGPNGMFSLFAPIPQGATVTARANGVETFDVNEAISFECEGREKYMEFEVGYYTYLRVVVRDESGIGIPGARVHYKHKSPTAGVSSRREGKPTDKNGVVRLRIFSGKWDLSAIAPGKVRSFTQSFQLELGVPHPTPIEIILMDGSPIEGAVIGKDGEPLASTTIRFIRVAELGSEDSTRMYSSLIDAEVITSAEGRFRTASLSPGAWYITETVPEEEDDPSYDGERFQVVGSTIKVVIDNDPW